MKRLHALALCMALLCTPVILMAGSGGHWRVLASAQADLPAVGTEDLPPGVSVQTMLSDMLRPVALAFDPQGRLFYTEKNTGNVRLFTNGALQPVTVIHFGVDTDNERGLLGIAVDPAFNSNHYIYAYYTCAVGPDCPNRENRVARFVESNGTGSSPTVIFSSPATSAAGQHNGGNIHFGPDGKLYITVGENGNPPNSQDLSDKHGKIHRINPDGSIPADNPKFTAPGALPSIYALGLRNSFDFAFDPVVPGRIFASENGPGCDDEMNRIEAGYNYGWRPNYPCDDTAQGGPDPHFNTIPPLWSSGQDCCPVPTGITVYTGNQIPGWHNHLFMSTFQGSGLFHFYLNDDRTGLTAVNAVRGVSATLDIETGPDGALWYIEGGGNSVGSLKRIAAGEPSPTTTEVAANPTATPVVATPTTAAVTGTPQPAPTVPGSGSRLFPETGQSVSGIFLDYWNTHGDLTQQGFPISGPMTEVSDLDSKPYTVQYFERAVFENHPENQTPFNVLLSQLGTFQYRRKYPNGAPNQQANNSTGSLLFHETGHRVGGKFLLYWQEHGGLMQQGFPISEEFTEVSDLNGKPYTVQYFERAVFELHPENPPPYDVLLSQLGTFQYREKYRGR